MKLDDPALFARYAEWCDGVLRARGVQTAELLRVEEIRRRYLAAERHEPGLRMVCDVLEMEGWDTVFLGASVPVEALVSMVVERPPAVVALSAAIAPHLPRVRETIGAIRRAVPRDGPVIAVGGRAFAGDPGRGERLGAELTARDAVEAATRLKERLAA